MSYERQPLTLKDGNQAITVQLPTGNSKNLQSPRPAPCKHCSKTLVPRISAGVSLYPQHGIEATELIRRADIALTVAQWHTKCVNVSSAVNLSVMDLQDDALPDRIEGYLAQHGLTATDLIIEVTESAMMRDAEKALKILHNLHDRGFTVSIDDSGTGYSSLAKLRDLPIDELKIDRSFIIDIKPDTTEALIVKAIIDLGHGMDMKITTEGIETSDEWDVLKNLGDDMQRTHAGMNITRPPLSDLFFRFHRHLFTLT